MKPLASDERISEFPQTCQVCYHCKRPPHVGHCPLSSLQPALISASAKPSALRAVQHLPPVITTPISLLNFVPWKSSSELHEYQSILINNQHAVLYVTLPPYLATHLVPLYSLFNLSALVSTDPTVPTDPLHPQPSPTVPPLNLSTPSTEAPASDVLPTPTPVSAALLPPQSSVEQAPTPSSLPTLQHHSPAISNPPLPLVNSLHHRPPVRRPPPPPRTHVTSNPTAGLPLPADQPLSYAQATAREHRCHQPSTDTLPPPSNQIPPSTAFHASILSMSPAECLATLLQPSITPSRAPQPVSSLVVQVPLSRTARERPTWSACRAIESQSSYPILDANILPGLHPVPFFEIFFHTTFLEPLRTFLQPQGLLHASQPLLPQDIQRRSATYNRSKDKLMRAASLNGFSPEQLLLLDHAQRRVSAQPLARQRLVQ